MTRIALPAHPTAMNMADLLGMARDIFAASDGSITLEGKQLAFIDPCGLAVMASVADKVAGTLAFDGFADQLSYLSRMDVFPEWLDRTIELGERRDRRDALLEVRRIQRFSDTGKTARELVDCLLGCMDDLPEDETPDEMTCMTRRDALEEPLAYIFSELLDNVVQHGRCGNIEASAWVCGQYYPSNGKVRFAIVDDGCGILESLRDHPRLATPVASEAICLALEERVSGSREFLMRGADHAANQGVGLTVTSRIIKQAGGRMWIASGDACHELPADITQRVSPWQGCIIAAEVPRDRLMQVRVHQVIGSLAGAGDAPDLDFF